MAGIPELLSGCDLFWAVCAFGFFGASCVHLSARQVTAHVNVLFQDLIRYGKTKEPGRYSWLRVFDVPKRWFWHFYSVSVCWNGLLLVLVLKSTFQDQPHPSWLSGLLDLLSGAPRSESHAPQLVTLLAQLLLVLHSLRRLQECLFVSVFSGGSIHLVQYLFGLVYYVMMGLTVLSTDRLETGSGALLSQLSVFHVAGGVVFVLASLMQHQCMVHLARLRTGVSGSVETLAHKLPEGGWFDLVSCPQYLSELLIYLSLVLMYGGVSLTWWIVFMYVFFSHALLAQLSHEFYISKYESYPKSKKAFIPFVL